MATTKKATKSSKSAKTSKSAGLNKSKTMLLLAAMVAVFGGLFFALNVRAEASTLVVNAANTQGWFTAGTANGGTVTYTGDAAAPFGAGALQLKTDTNVAAKAQYLKAVSMPLADLTSLSYFTKQTAGELTAVPTFQIEVKLHGIADGLTTFVYEPHYNGEVTLGQWQKWDLSNGQFWSTTSIPPVVVEGNGGEPFYTLDYLKGWYEQAEIVAFGVNVGTNETGVTALVDGIAVNDVTYDFEGSAPAPMTKEACKNGGWRDYPELYKNQGACVSSVTKS